VLIVLGLVGSAFLFAAWFMALFGPNYSEGAILIRVAAVFIAFALPLWLAYRIWPWKHNAITISGHSAGSP
jgi:hypothetical protein